MEGYRKIAGSMCYNCKHSAKAGRCLDPIDSVVSIGLIVSCKARKTMVSAYAWCPKHEPTAAYLEHFESHHAGALPVVVMIPPPDSKGQCSSECPVVHHERYENISRKECSLGMDRDGYPSKGCPHYKGGKL